MEFFINDLSIHQQFSNVRSFLASFEEVMAMRKTAARFNRKIYRHRSFLRTKVAPNISIQQAVNNFPESRRRYAQIWLTNRPNQYWDESTQHGPDDYLECGGEIVTDSAVGEAAYRSLHDCIRRGLLSFTSQKWNISPVRVVWHENGDGDSDAQYVDIENWWNHDELEKELQQYSRSNIRSWSDLQNELRSRCDHLDFLDGCFTPLSDVQFSKGLAHKIFSYFEILNKFAGAFSADGERTSGGARLYQDHFTGDKAWFSDSTDDEKIRFGNKMTFHHPEHDDGFLYSWHGKPRRGVDPIRFHFSWPIRANEPVYIAYVGPKLTKR